MVKKILGAMFALALVGGILAGCSSGETPAEGETTGGAAPATGETTGG
jgi:hypothetical protein